MTDIPKGAKRPADKKPKKTAEAPPEEITVTIDDHDYVVATDALDDFELLDDLNTIDQDEDPTRLPSVMRRLLGPDQTREALRRLRDPDSQRVSMEAGTQFVMDLMTGCNPNS
ncbi:hypothetical protein [Nocardioides jensenii]|uniref:hypothetical protein n=1 Tax=Nocardioides jensenii TaxID=1843 RepID=UPI000836D6A9|nr:hypothetical protein [Nocardioides jensenii]